MANKPRVLVDINILLDVLQRREPFYEHRLGLLALMDRANPGIIAAHRITTLFYLIQKDKCRQKPGRHHNLLQFIKIAPLDQSTIEQALNLDYRDYEDAVQMIAAVQCKADCLVTRNVKDYQPVLLPVLQPVDFLGTL